MARERDIKHQMVAVIPSIATVGIMAKHCNGGFHKKTGRYAMAWPTGTMYVFF